MEIFNFDFGFIIEKYDLNTVSLKDVKQILRSVSLDMVSGDNTITTFADNVSTYLYSGYVNENIHSNTLVTNISEARIIDKTEAGYLLNDTKFKELIKKAIENDIINEIFSIDDVKNGLYTDDMKELNSILNKSDLKAKDVMRAAEIATDGYLFEPTKGAWATISERFIEETPSGSNIYCITANADLNRTWGQVEVIKVLEVMPEDKVIGNTTVGELRHLKDTNVHYSQVSRHVF